MREALTSSGAVQPARHSAVMWLLVLLALALGLLNPLACIIHCLPRPIAVPGMNEAFGAICHTPTPSASQAPVGAAELTSGQSQAPQAAFAFVAPWLLVLLVGVRRAAVAGIERPAAAQLILRPLSPPPR